MTYREIQMNYNKIIYLEMIDNTISRYKKEVLMGKYKEMLEGFISYRDYYDNYNDYVIKLIKTYNYYQQLQF